MTQTRRWLENRRAELARKQLVATGLTTLGAVLTALAVGLALGRLGAYQAAPPSVVLAWLVAVSAVVHGLVLYRHRAKAVSALSLAAAVEQRGGLRRGLIGGMTSEPGSGSAALIRAADTRASRWLESRGADALMPVRRRGTRSLWLGALVGVVGAGLFALAGPTNARAAAFWRPVSVLESMLEPVVLTVDRSEIRRGENVVAHVFAPGRLNVELLTRAPGEPWSGEALALDSLGNAFVTLGPLEVDHFLRATSGRRSSETIQIRVAVPAFLASLALRARFPAYMGRSDERLFPGDSVLLPYGTRVITDGQATVPLESVAWRFGERDPAPLTVEVGRFTGEVVLTRSGRWTLEIEPEGAVILDEPNPTLFAALVRDSVPVVTVPVPGTDTVAPTSLLQSLVVDARDDHLITRVELLTRRVSRLGIHSDTTSELLFLPEGGAERAVLPWVMNLNDRGFLPGDTAYYRVRAWDNAPIGQFGQSEEFAIRLPSRREMRQEVRDVANELTTDADSLLRAQRELARETEALAASRERNERSGGEQGLEFEQAERAREIGEEQAELMKRAQELAEALKDLSEAGWEAGVNDEEWHKQLEELQKLMEDALTPEMRELLSELQEALERLDPEAVQEALQQLSEQQQQLQEQFERSRELLERAALEGALSNLAEDAEDLAEKQENWNQSAEHGLQSDSALAAAEEQLAQQEEQIQEQLQQMQEALEDAERSGEAMQEAQQQTGQAAQQMQQAASQAQQGQRKDAQQSGENASEQLNPVSQQLQQQLEEMRQDFREEVLDIMDHALTETADLAQRQENVAGRLQRGETNADVRSEQAALRESVDRVIKRLQDAAGKNALVSPALSTALGFARLRMTEALEQFEQPTPNTRQASEMAGEAVDGLNAVASALMRNRGDVEQSSSGSGMAEAMQKMAEMAAQQESMNGQTGSIMPLLPQGGQELMQRLQEIAQQERSMAEELERMAAEEALPGATEELAEEAEEIARQLESGVVDRQTLERQEQLFRRLLDAGRSLRSEEEDEREERQSETANPDNVRLPPSLDPDALGAGARYPYPEWDQLRRFSPEERRLILDYFRRLNDRTR